VQTAGNKKIPSVLINNYFSIARQLNKAIAQAGRRQILKIA
jgi:hypothetical protein